MVEAGNGSTDDIGELSSEGFASGIDWVDIGEPEFLNHVLEGFDFFSDGVH